MGSLIILGPMMGIMFCRAAFGDYEMDGGGVWMARMI